MEQSVMYQVMGDCLVVQMPRELDQHTADGLIQEMDFLLDSYGVHRLVFDFEDTEFMDSAGIGVVIGRSKKLKYIEGITYAVHMSERVERIFRMSGIDQIVQIIEEDKTDGKAMDQ